MYTVVIPTFNSTRNIVRTISSILNQSIRPITIYIIDDMSDDFLKLKNIIDDFNHIDIILIQNTEKKNAAFNRNIGWSKGTEKYVFFLDSDDEWLPFHAETTLSILNKNPSTICVFNNFFSRNTNSEKLPKYYSNNNELKETILIDTHVNPLDLLMSKGFDFRSSTIAVRSDLFFQITFDRLLDKHQDWDLFITMIDGGFNVIKSSKTSVVLNEFGSYRMSSKNNLDASMYFMKKWRIYINSSNFNTLITGLYRSALKNRSYAELKKLSHISESMGVRLKIKIQCIRILCRVSIHFVIMLYLVYTFLIKNKK